MAKIIKNWNYLIDKNEETFIGVKLPYNPTSGYEASTKTTLEAVKFNLLNLCSTARGERVMQPSLGINLRQYLFEPFSEDLVFEIQDIITESIKIWLPFVTIINIEVKMSDSQSGVHKNTMDILITFSLKKDIRTHESVQITVG